MSGRATRLVVLVGIAFAAWRAAPMTVRAGGPAPGGIGGGQAGAAGPNQAILVLIASYRPGGHSVAGCRPVQGQYASCPVTARLRQRLSSNVTSVCFGCQNPPRHVVIGVGTVAG